ELCNAAAFLRYKIRFLKERFRRPFRINASETDRHPLDMHESSLYNTSPRKLAAYDDARHHCLLSIADLPSPKTPF
ncbi:hypothetical protein AVEN_52522-1, partial [Araneus ventricosus]